jgi:hypothetical protein
MNKDQVASETLMQVRGKGMKCVVADQTLYKRLTSESRSLGDFLQP